MRLQLSRALDHLSSVRAEVIQSKRHQRRLLRQLSRVDDEAMKRSQACPACKQTVSMSPKDTGNGLWMQCAYCSNRWQIERKKEEVK